MHPTKFSIWEATELYSKIFCVKSVLIWKSHKLLYNSNQFSLRLAYILNFSGCFIFGCLFTSGLVLHEVCSKNPQIPLLILIIFGVAATCSLSNCIQVLIRKKYGENFVYGFNQIVEMQKFILRSKANFV